MSPDKPFYPLSSCLLWRHNDTPKSWTMVSCEQLNVQADHKLLSITHINSALGLACVNSVFRLAAGHCAPIDQLYSWTGLYQLSFHVDLWSLSTNRLTLQLDWLVLTQFSGWFFSHCPPIDQHYSWTDLYELYLWPWFTHRSPLQFGRLISTQFSCWPLAIVHPQINLY